MKLIDIFKRKKRVEDDMGDVFSVGKSIEKTLVVLGKNDLELAGLGRKGSKKFIGFESKKGDSFIDFEVLSNGDVILQSMGDFSTKHIANKRIGNLNNIDDLSLELKKYAKS
ncbi:MAG: hypothetical protein ACOC1K_05455 [Nanoarchaeota archaeon]